jgi:hypothetical protein
VELEEWHRWWKRTGATTINRFLLEKWDPIYSPFDDPEIAAPSDEYVTYAGTVGRMLREGASAEEIARYLEEMERDHIGLGYAEDRSALAGEIVSWFRAEMGAADAS